MNRSGAADGASPSAPGERLRLHLRDLVEMPEDGTQQPVDAGEGEIGFRLEAGRPQHREPGGLICGVLEQCALADPRLAPNDEHAALSVCGVREQAVDLRTLALSADQLGAPVTHACATHLWPIVVAGRR